MAGKRAETPIERVPINLTVGDWAKMGALFPRLGAGPAIRTLVRNYIRQIEASAPVNLDIPLSPTDLKDLLDDDRDSDDGTSADGPETDPGTVR